MTQKEFIQMLKDRIEVGFEKGIQTALQNLNSDNEIMRVDLVNRIIEKCYNSYKKFE